MRRPLVPIAFLALIAPLQLASGQEQRAQEQHAQEQRGQEQREQETPPPTLSVEAVEVLPEAPGVDTLCQLRVRIRNPGERIASQLAFAVTVGGHELPVYRNQLFMQALPPGEVSEVRLYNFWSTETGRPAPADGRLRVEVALTEAHWYRIAEDDDGVEVWTPLEAVPGLPASRAVTVTMPGVAPAAAAQPGDD